MKYSESYRTRWHDTDAERRVSPSQLLVYMQETSNGHTATAGLPLDDLRDQKHLAFILSKLRLEIYRPLYAFEDIRVETWTSPSRGFSSLRSFRILRGDEVIASADSTWALVGTEDGALHKSGESGYAFEDEEAVTLSLPNRIRFPAGIPLKKIGERRVVYSDLDYNMHMNNTRYPNMLCDFLPMEEIGRIRGMVLSYLHEGAFGSTLTVLSAKEGENRYFRTLDENGTACLEAQIILEG
ncbi:MAG: hypothetical protein IKA76_02590 [Clostridia bacterium]|nr:hypothetical protein [Clostridia bacterium]